MGRTFSFFYGVIAYIIFLGSFLYAIPFVSDFLVTKTINTGAETPFGQALMINLSVLTIFALQHSIMARHGFKSWWTSIIPKSIERSTYVLLASLALLLIFWQWRPMGGIIWEVQNENAVALVYAIYGLGWFIVLLSTFMINHFDLFGLKQVYENLKNIEPQPIPFKVSFFYSIVRHPIMLGFIIAFWAAPVMTTGRLVFAITTTLYIWIAIKFLEERDLKKLHGATYVEYQKKVPMLIPFLRKK